MPCSNQIILLLLLVLMLLLLLLLLPHLWLLSCTRAAAPLLQASCDRLRIVAPDLWDLPAVTKGMQLGHVVLMDATACWFHMPWLGA